MPRNFFLSRNFFLLRIKQCLRLSPQPVLCQGIRILLGGSPPFFAFLCVSKQRQLRKHGLFCPRRRKYVHLGPVLLIGKAKGKPDKTPVLRFDVQTHLPGFLRARKHFGCLAASFHPGKRQRFILLYRNVLQSVMETGGHHLQLQVL